MDKYLNINNSCEIVYGENGAVLYDFDSSKIYNIEVIKAQILRSSQNGIALEKLFFKYGQTIVEKFIEDLIKARVGYIANTFIPTETYRVGNIKVNNYRKTYTLQRVYLELPIGCNNNCKYCNIQKLNGCFSCSIPKDIYNKDLDFYTSIIDKLCELNCETIILHGGDPLAEWGFTKKILEHILSQHNNKPNITLITNYTEINHEILQYFAEHNINIVLNVGYSIQLNSADISSYYNNLLELGVNCIVNFNIEYKDIENFWDLYDILSFSCKNIYYSIYSNSEDELLKINYMSDLPNNIIDPSTVVLSEFSHPCLFGTMSIKSDRKVYPCIGFNTNELLDLKKYNLKTLFFKSDELLKLWNMSIVNLENCSKCKFRKSCCDCRAFELSISEKIDSKLSCQLI